MLDCFENENSLHKGRKARVTPNQASECGHFGVECVQVCVRDVKMGLPCVRAAPRGLRHARTWFLNKLAPDLRRTQPGPGAPGEMAPARRARGADVRK